ncbi:hypothetical protein BDW22DRAFT_1361628 [Trametopsis cervina]|nr:hypothetical protein BDW22DRAFT_1361628 [Trametopsis cervina]
MAGLPPFTPIFPPPSTPTLSDSTSSSSATTLSTSASDTSIPPAGPTLSSSSSSPSSDSSSSSSSFSDLSSSSSSASDSSSSSSASSSSLSSSSSSFSPTPTLSGIAFPSTQSDGEVITVTSTSLIIPTGGSGSTVATQNNAASKGFFANHGAVAGVFTVVGLVALALFIALLTNAVRRRRARKFDKDVAEAAREAAAAAHASPPDFHDFDEEYGYGNRSVYTDQTHGTYNQQPVKPSGAAFESYNMAELPAPAAYGAPLYNSAGVGAAGLNRSRSTTAPYNAFAGPPTSSVPAMPVADPFTDPTIGVGGIYPSPPMPHPQPYRMGSSEGAEAGLAEAAGLGAVGVGAVTTARHQGNVLNRSKSGKTLGTLGSSSDHGEAAYNPYEYSQYPPAPQPIPQPHQAYAAPLHQPRPVSTATTGEDPYAAYTSASPTSNRFSPEDSDRSEGDDDQHHESQHHHGEDDNESLRDDEDYGYGSGRRVLRVANE